MSGILSQLRTATENLHELSNSWALVGALAVSVYTEPRTTRDIDIAIVLKTNEEQLRIIEQLQKRGFSKASVQMHTLPTHKLGFRLGIPTSTGTSVALDLLCSSTGIEEEIVLGANKLEVFPKLFIPVASVGHLIGMKLLSQNDSDRLRDRDDLHKLIQIASPDEISTASNAVRLIQERGFSRGLNLVKLFSEITHNRK